jgi:hypothetical protein
MISRRCRLPTSSRRISATLASRLTGEHEPLTLICVADPEKMRVRLVFRLVLVSLVGARAWWSRKLHGLRRHWKAATNVDVTVPIRPPELASTQTTRPAPNYRIAVSGSHAYALTLVHDGTLNWRVSAIDTKTNAVTARDLGTRRSSKLAPSWLHL